MASPFFTNTVPASCWPSLFLDWEVSLHVSAHMLYPAESQWRIVPYAISILAEVLKSVDQRF